MLAGVTPRTVRYYIAEGLVDRPVGEKRGAHYVRRHLEQLLLIRRWTDAGLSLERVRELLSGAPEDPAPRRAAPGSIEVWSRVTVADGLEIHVEPGRADLTPDQMRSSYAASRRSTARCAPQALGIHPVRLQPPHSRTRENNDE
jgi:DNA-binding transcriptional MerR regulator